MHRDADLRFEVVCLDGGASLPWENVLGAACFGGRTRAGAVPAQVPLVDVMAPVLDAHAALPIEVWRTERPAVSGEQGIIRYRHDGDTLFACAALDESTARGADPDSALQELTSRVYRELLATLRALGYPHVIRIWNYLPRINEATRGLERYRQFNRARRDALLASGEAVQGSVPAACALGTRDGETIVVYCLASRRVARLIENPRQVSAYHYPAQYGPKPAFSRACVLDQPGGSMLFISGTASIVGHESMHPGDVAAQTDETLRNIEALVQESNRSRNGDRFELSRLAAKVYIRHAHDLPVVRARLSAALGDPSRLLFLRADICREDLLVEIEAVGTARR